MDKLRDKVVMGTDFDMTDHQINQICELIKKECDELQLEIATLESENSELREHLLNRDLYGR